MPPCRYCEIFHSSGPELYDVQTDIEKFADIIAEEAEAAETLDEQLHAWVDSVPRSHSSEVSFDENEDVLEQMEDLGYL